MKIAGPFFFSFFSFIFLTSCTHLYYRPTSALYHRPENLGLKYENQIFESRDGTRLHSWYFSTSKKKKGLVALFHGNAQNLSAHYPSVSWMLRYGYDVWVWDYRGYGLSQGTPSGKGIFEDTLAALKYIHFLKEGKLILVGQSLGGNLLMKALEESPFRSDADFVILDSTFLSYKKLARDKLAHLWFLWPFQWLANILISDEFNPERNLKKIKNPVLILHGSDDRVVPFSYGREVYQKIQSPQKWFWKIPGGRHIGTLGRGEGDYERNLIELIERGKYSLDP